MPSHKTIHQHEHESRVIGEAYEAIIIHFPATIFTPELRQLVLMNLRIVYHEGGRAALSEMAGESKKAVVLVERAR